MIRSEQEYREAKSRLVETEQLLQEQANRLREIGVQSEDLHRAMAPSSANLARMRDELHAFEEARRGRLREVTRLSDIGRLLIGARISRGMSQRELARRLGVAESSVSRDEKNQYKGISTARAERVFDALGINVKIAAVNSEARA